MIKIWLKKILTVFVVFLIFVLFMELIYKLKYSSNEDIITPGFDRSNLYRVSANLLLSYEYLPIGEANLDGVEFKINSHGLRDYDYNLTKPNNTSRILVFGDSVAVGHGVPLEFTFVKKLENLLNAGQFNKRYEVLNFGVSGYNTLQESELFQTKGVHYDPDLIILYFVINDCDETLFLPFSQEKNYERQDIINSFLPKKCSRRTNLKRFFEGSYFLKYSSVLNALEKSSLFLTVHPFDKSYLDRINLNAYQKKIVKWYKNQYDDDCVIGQVDRGFSVFSSISRNQDIPILLVVFPFKYYVPPYPYTFVHEKISDLAISKGFLVLDLEEKFDNDNNYNFFIPRDIVHPNIHGHELIANETLNYLLENDLLT